MKRIKIGLLLIFVVCVFGAFSQHKSKCVLVDTLKLCTVDSLGIFSEVEKDAIFSGGNRGLNDYLNNVDLSGADIQNESTKISLLLIIDSLGKVKPYKINGKNVSTQKLSTLENKYLDMLKEMPNWEPAICYGKRVPSYFSISYYIDFK